VTSPIAPTDPTNRRVMVAMSGGVDSSVAAALLVEAGYEVVGVTLRLWGGESDNGCCAVSDVEDARRVAQQLDIDHHVFNLADEFDRHVVAPYVDDHAEGRTPNPCIECNRHLKFDRLMSRARALGFERVATGHHAAVVTLDDGTRRLTRGADTNKDQSYVLYMLGQEVLGRVMFPVGAMTKEQVRARASELGLRTATKPDSQDVCFITSTAGREGFLTQRVELHPGRMVDTSGAELGTVDAVELVTVGQRRGLGLSGAGEHRYAIDVDVSSRTVTIGTRRQLEVDTTTVRQLEWADRPVTGALAVQASAHGTPVAAVVTAGEADEVVVRWDAPVRRIAPGQSVVFYESGPCGELVVGGGIAV